MPVDNCHKSHKPVETSNFLPMTIQGLAGDTKVQPDAEMPLTGR